MWSILLLSGEDADLRSGDRASPGPTRVHVDLPPQCLDIEPPPSRCHVRTHGTRSGFVVTVWSRQGPHAAIEAWARSEWDLDTLGLGELGGRTSAFACEALPDPLSVLFEDLNADQLVLDADGTASTWLQAGRDELSAYLGGLPGDVHLDSVTEDPDRPRGGRPRFLTERQHVVTVQAAALGYFEVPRRIQLDDLAGELDTSRSALSELLRRAQASLVAAYLDGELGGIEAVVDADQPIQ